LSSLGCKDFYLLDLIALKRHKAIVFGKVNSPFTIEGNGWPVDNDSLSACQRNDEGNERLAVDVGGQGSLKQIVLHVGIISQAVTNRKRPTAQTPPRSS
jgi:hypothetical protein